MQVAGGISTVPAGNISQNVKLDYSALSISEKMCEKGTGGRGGRRRRVFLLF